MNEPESFHRRWSRVIREGTMQHLNDKQTPSETRAGKFPIGPLLKSVGMFGDFGNTQFDGQPIMDAISDAIAWAECDLPEALAASEPVEAVAVVEVNGLSLSGIIRTKYGRSIDLRDGTKLYTHPAPEQPGKGEACERCGGIEIVAGPPCDVCGKTNITQPSDPAEGESLARRFHETYERLAPQFRYETRTETRNFDPSSPNGRLMIAVCTELAALSTPTTAAVRIDEQRAALNKALDYFSVGSPGCSEAGMATLRSALAALDPQVKR